MSPLTQHEKAIITGRLRYSQDVEFPNMLHARVLRSPFPHARIVSVDTSAVPAGIATIVPADVRDLNPYGCQVKDQTVLAIDRARHVGDVVAAVAASTPEAARLAVTLIDVEYEELPAVLDLETALAATSLVHDQIRISDNDAAYFGMRPEPGTNVCHRFQIVHGDIDEAFARSEITVEDTYRTACAQHAAMEPHASVARWQDGRLEIWTGTHTPFNVRSDLAAIFGLEEDCVRVVCPPIGGSFGAKTFVHTEAIAAALARKAGRPVRLILDRAEEWETNGRHPSVIRIRIGATADGDILAKEVDSSIDTGAYADCGPGVAVKIGYSAIGAYRIPNALVESRCVYTHLPPNGAFRGYGATQAVWASELLMDRLAEELSMDPLELRLRNVLRDGDTFCTGEKVRDVHFADCLEKVAATSGWAESRAGKGLAVVMKGMQTPSRAGIAVEAEGGGFVLLCATAEMGQGVKTALQLHASELLGVPPEKIRFPDPDTDVVPYDTRATSSRSTYMMTGALAAAVADLRRDGQRGFGEFHNHGGLDPDTGQGIASSHWHQGACAATIDVDEETGRVRVRDLHVATYAGAVVNPHGAENQIVGSMTMGLGSALLESVTFADGQVTNPNLSDYQIPAITDLPAMGHELLTRVGAEIHGLGETGVPPVPAAVGNALASLGIHVNELPITSEAVLLAIDSSESIGK